MSFPVKMFGESWIHVREQNAIEAIVFVKFLPDVLMENFSKEGLKIFVEKREVEQL